MSSLQLRTTFKSWELGSAELPVEIYRQGPEHLTFVGRAMTMQTFPVEPGSYFAVLHLPAGVEMSGEATVEAGESQPLVLTLDAADESPNETQELARLSWGYTDSPETEELDHLAYEKTAQLVTHSGNALLEEKAGGPAGAHEVELQPSQDASPAGTHLFEATPRGLGFVQLRVSGQAPVNVALAGSPDPNEGEQYAVTVSAQADGSFAVEARLRNVAADTLLAYAETGQLQSAAAMTGSVALSAERLLYKKRRSPVAAAVGAYALLRMGELERLHNWPANLSSWFEWLPDGLVVRAEHLWRVGEEDQAIELLLQLPQRGLPVFTDGLSLALDRLGGWVSQRREAGDPARLIQAKLLLDRLREYAPYVDFRKSILTFTGAAPGAPDGRELSRGDDAELVGHPVADSVPAGV